jgi:hypothetical protein
LTQVRIGWALHRGKQGLIYNAHVWRLEVHVDVGKFMCEVGKY